MLLALLAGAAVLRLAALGSIPNGLSHDEAVKGYDAWSVLRTGRDQYGERFPIVFRAIGDEREAAMPYLIVLSEAVFGPTDFAVRLPAALAGVALVLGTYLLGGELLGRRAGLLAAALLTISPWHVQISRLAFRAGLTPVCVVFGLWLFLRGLRRGGPLVPAGAVLGLSLHTYLGARAFLPLLLAGMTVLYRGELRARPRAAVAGAATLGLVAAPLLIWGITHRADFVGHAGASAGWREAGDALPFARQSARKYAAYLGPGNLVLHGDPYPVPSTGRFGVLYWPALPLFAAGVILLARRGRPHDRLVLWWLLAFPLAPALTEGRPPDWLRSSTGLPVFELITAGGCVAAWTGMRAGGGGRPTPSSSRSGGRVHSARLAAALFAVAIAVNTAVFLYDYSVFFPGRSAWAFHDGIAPAMRRLAALEPGFDQVVLPKRIPAIHDSYLFYSRYDPRRLHAEGLDDVAPPGAWADVRGFGKVRVCDPHACCAAGAICLVEGRDAAWPAPLAEIRDRTGRVAYSIVVGTMSGGPTGGAGIP